MNAGAGDVLVFIAMIRFFFPFFRAVGLAVLVPLVSAPPAAAQSGNTVQEAAAVVGTTLGPQSLDALVAVIGHYGTPQPKTWEFNLVDPGTKGAVRALRVSGPRATPKAPENGGYESTVPTGFFRWQDVKVDSITAFHAADQEARAAMVGFDSVQFLLRAREGTAQPVWLLSLWDQEERTVGRLEISASTGKVERRVWMRYSARGSAPLKVEDSFSPYASMRPQPPPVTVPPVEPTLPTTPPAAPPGWPATPPVVPPLPPVAPDGVVVPPPLPEVPPPSPEPAPGYTPLPN